MSRRFSFLRHIAAILVVFGVVAGTGAAQAKSFGAYHAEVQPAEVFPGADRFGAVEGNPPARAAYAGDKLLGYVFETSDIGYSGKPIKVLAGMDVDGVIVGARVTEHHEPILLVGIPEERLFEFVAKYVGKSVVEATKPGTPKPVVDIVSGATVTVIVVDDGLLRTGLKVARTRGLAGFDPKAATEKASLADLPFAATDWQVLLGEGSVRRLNLSNADVDAAFDKMGVGKAAYQKAGPAQDAFIDLYAALITPEIIGRNLLGDAEYQNLKAWLAPGQQAVMIAANGEYSFRGSGFVRGAIFDRFQLVQEGLTIVLRDKQYRRLGSLQGNAPDFAEIGLFKIPEGIDFDPTKPWRVELLAQRATGGTNKAFTSFSLGYDLPARFIQKAPVKPAAAVAVADDEEADSGRADLWRQVWQNRLGDIAVLTVALTILFLGLFFQDVLVRRPKLFDRLRLAYLVFTVVWIGGYAQAQLSVVNVFTFTNALMTGFRWDFFLLDPLIFILWGFTAVTLLFWGRGPFCGWLCPVGALQELIYKAARFFGVRTFTIPFAVHERLWAVKYVVLLALFALSLNSLATAEHFAEIEPFKTIVLLRFDREWQFVLWAVVLLGGSIWVERIFCRYLCPLGAGLAIGGRFRLFDWLKRRKECGHPCHLCARNCTVQAIHPDGHINQNECLYCLDCQVTHEDEARCPPLVKKAKARAAAQAQPAEPALADFIDAARQGRAIHRPVE